MPAARVTDAILAAAILLTLIACSRGSGVPQNSGIIPFLPLRDHAVCGEDRLGRLFRYFAETRPNLKRKGGPLTLVLRGGSSMRRSAAARGPGSTSALEHTPLEKTIGKIVSAIQGAINSIVSLYHQVFLDPLLELVMGGERVDQEAPQDRAHQHDRPIPAPPPWEDVVVPTAPSVKDLVVPNWKYENLKDAIESAKNGERVYCRNGDHHWDGKITVKGKASSRGLPRELHVVGEGDTRLWGRWSVSRYSQGSFKAVMCAYETEGVGWPCVLIRGDPWLFDSCQIRSAGAYAVMCAKTSRVTLRRCGVGGMGGGARRAINTVIVMDSSWCLMQQCQIEDTDYAHPGVRLMENARGGLENCTVQRNGYGVAVDNNAKVFVHGCTLFDNDHAAFYAGYEAANAEMDIKQCTVYGRVWHTNDRPGKLSECDNRFTVSSMAMSIPALQDMERHAAEDQEFAGDLSWRFNSFPGKKREDTSPKGFSRRMSFTDLRGMSEGGGVESRSMSGGAQSHSVRSPSALGAPNVAMSGGGGAARHMNIARRHSSAELLGVAEGLQDDMTMPGRSNSANAG